MYSIYFFVIAVTYFGPGTVDTIKFHLNAVESKAVILLSTDHLIDSLLQCRNSMEYDCRR